MISPGTPADHPIPRWPGDARAPSSSCSTWRRRRAHDPQRRRGVRSYLHEIPVARRPAPGSGAWRA
ncbi:MAG: hypothetical protein R2838_09735 [Caldilineaceae bacterium]